MIAAAIGAHVIGSTRLLLLQRIIPALTGAIIVVDAKLGEQQRPANVLEGITARIPGADRLRKGFVADRSRDLGSVGANPSRP